MAKVNLSRPIQMIFRVSEREKAVIRRKMEFAKINNQSAFLRKIALEGMILNVDYSQLRDIFGELGRIGNVINQIGKRVNETGHIYKEDIAEIKEKQEKIVELYRQIDDKLL